MAKYADLNLGQIEAIGNKLGGMTGIMQFLAGELVVVAKTAAKKLLECIEVVAVPNVTRFVADDHFKNGQTVDGVKVFLGGNFKKRFGGKIEEGVPGCDIRIHKLSKASGDVSILYEIGEDREETYLAHFWHFLKFRGENGGWFVFYIHDTERTLWAVHARWHGGGWSVATRSVLRCVGWSAGRCFCSR